MALVANGMNRVFQLKKGQEKIMLDDPNPALTMDEVMMYYSNIYPELTTATVSGPEIKDDKLFYEFKTTIGTKG